jgi:erythromycin esterase
MNPLRPFVLHAALLLATPSLFAQSISGVVRDILNKPVAGAIVAAVPVAAVEIDDIAGVVRTDAEGRYRFAALAPGKYALTVTAHGLVARFVPEIELTTASDKNADVVLEMAGGSTLSGRTLDAAGKPRAVRVVAARYSKEEGDLFVAESDADGRYELRLPEAEYFVAADAPGTSSAGEHVSLHADLARDVRFERKFAAPPPEALAWIRKSAVPIATADPGALDDLAPLGAIVGDAHVVALGEATHGTREFFQLKHRIVQYLVEKKGFTVFAIEATMPGTLTVNDYVVDGKGSATAALEAMQFWTWRTDEVRALIEWMRAWNAAHDRKVKFLGFDMQDPAGALKHLQRYLETRDAEYAATMTETFAPLRNPDTYRDRTEAEKQQAIAAFDTLARHVDAQLPHDAEWELASRMVEVLRQGEAQYHGEGTTSQIRDRAMAENARWILAHEPAGTKMVLWAHNGHVSAEPAPFFVNGTMGSHLRATFGKDLVIFGFAFNRGNFRAIESSGEKRGLTDRNHLDAAPAGSFDAALASARLPLFALDLRKATGVTREWLDSPLRSRGVGAAFNGSRPSNFIGTLHPLRSYDVVVFVEHMTAAHGHDLPPRPPAPPVPPAPAAVNLGFEEGTIGSLPNGWRQAEQSRAAGFAARMTDAGCATGRCLDIERREVPTDPRGSGVVMQRIDATPFRGKRVRLRANVRSELTGAESTANVWLRVDLPKGELGFFDNMMKTAPHAPRTWTEETIEGEVAANAEAIAFGALFLGTGRAWYDDFTLEVLP